jgi:exodeoxyribonuclease VII large subunit
LIGRSILKLSDLTLKLQQTVETTFGGRDFWVIADVSNHTFKADANIHYFELVEKDAQSSRILAKVAGRAWGAAANQIKNFERVTGQLFKNDIQVLVHVAVQYHMSYGLQLNLLDIEANFTLGKFERERNETLLKLAADNSLFIQKRGNDFITKNKLLQFNCVIQQIAVISSETSAGFQDFQHTLLHNDYQYHFHLDSYFTKVQGELNAKLILAKLIAVYESGIVYDAVVIIRGGGSQSDFLLFDNYELSRAVAKFPIPIITGIGHHKNETIVDLMAHLSTKTPTKAAELIVAHNRKFEQRLLQLQQVIVIKTQQNFVVNNRALNQLKSTILNETIILLKRNERYLAGLSGRIINQPKMLLQQERKNVEHLLIQINTLNKQLFKHQMQDLAQYQRMVNLMSPESILKKGFAILELDGKIIANAALVEPGVELTVRMTNTKIKTMVTSKVHENGE